MKHFTKMAWNKSMGRHTGASPEVLLLLRNLESDGDLLFLFNQKLQLKCQTKRNEGIKRTTVV
jgi:hypothetical protein